MLSEENFSKAVWRKAQRAETYPGPRTLTLEVKSKSSERWYRAELMKNPNQSKGPSYWATCTCENGKKRGGDANCYHVAALVQALQGREWARAAIYDD